jgi:hypothetical protein
MKESGRMPEDIRDKAYITHEDVVALNFIKASGPFIFRRHYRQGLRSHIMEVINKIDAERERTGLMVDGVRWYPRARPVRMFRIFRTRLPTMETALREIRRVKVVERYLAPDYIATSNEVIVDYVRPGRRDILLCGFQTHEQGEIIDPWSLLNGGAFVAALYDRLQGSVDTLEIGQDRWVALVRKKAATFIQRIKEMIAKDGYIPDLAGRGNLVAAPSGEIKLVDINNISRVDFDSGIPLDDRGYPVCDKSIEALYLIEEKMAGRAADRKEALYQIFFNPQRRRAVKRHEEDFYRDKQDAGGYPAIGDMQL